MVVLRMVQSVRKVKAQKGCRVVTVGASLAVVLFVNSRGRVVPASINVFEENPVT